MAHPAIHAMVRKVRVEEILPSVDPVPGTSSDDYRALIERRLSNLAIGDTTRRVAFDGLSRHPGVLMPVLRGTLAAALFGANVAAADQGGPVVPHMTRAVAGGGPMGGSAYPRRRLGSPCRPGRVYRCAIGAFGSRRW